MKSPEWRWQWRRADLRLFYIFRHGPIIIYTRLPAGGTYYPICMFPTSSECLIGISDAFSAFCLRASGHLPPHVLTVMYPQQKRAYQSALHPFLSCCFTSTEARWPIRDGDRVGRGRESQGSAAETVRKRPERPWPAARTMEVLRRCPLAIGQRLVHCRRAQLLLQLLCWTVTKTMSVALQAVDEQLGQLEAKKDVQLAQPSSTSLLMIFKVWANMRVQLHLPPLRSLDLLISLGTLRYTRRHRPIYIQVHVRRLLPSAVP